MLLKNLRPAILKTKMSVSLTTYHEGLILMMDLWVQELKRVLWHRAHNLTYFVQVGYDYSFDFMIFNITFVSIPDI